MLDLRSFNKANELQQVGAQIVGYEFKKLVSKYNMENLICSVYLHSVFISCSEPIFPFFPYKNYMLNWVFLIVQFCPIETFIAENFESYHFSRSYQLLRVNHLLIFNTFAHIFNFAKVS